MVCRKKGWLPSSSVITLSTFQIREREVMIRLVKKEPDWWPRLLYEQRKLPWLKIDFDRWKDQDDSDDDDDDDNDLLGAGGGGGGPGRGMMGDDVTSADFLRQQYPDVYERLQKEELGFISESKRKIYLFCYNLFMFCGFLYVSLIMALRYCTIKTSLAIPTTFL